LLIALRGERASNDRRREELQKGKETAGFFQVQRRGAAVAPFPHDEELSMIASGALKGQRAALLRAYNDLVAAARLPPEQMGTRLRQLMASLARSNTAPAVQLFLTGQFPPQYALMRAAIAALAAERYRRQHGRWPDTLDALVPEFLPEVPLDPHDGKRLRYRRLEEGVVIYSVGPNLTDDGGILDRQPHFGGVATGTDIGVQLWDVQSRRQPPAAGPKK
jgi:hypothetical protein